MLKKKIKGNYKRTENVIITVTDLEGKVLEVKKIPNTIHNAGLNMQRDLWSGAITDGEIKRMAVGHSNAVIDETDETLGDEFFRKQITSQTNSGIGGLITLVSIAPNEAVGQIEEIGWFAGSGATDEVDSGIMVSRVLYSRNKTNLERIQVQRTDTVTEVV